MHTVRPWLGWICALLCTVIAKPGFAVESIPAGSFTNNECITCHLQLDPEIITQWRNGPHGATAKANCTDCHGKKHIDSVAMARRNRACTGCHAGPVSHSYTTSKHGIIVGLENSRLDWNKPLQRGQYRAPSCSYCHLHDNEHGDSMAPKKKTPVRQWICIGCHSPRYVRELFSSGNRQRDIAELKHSEGLALIQSASAVTYKKLGKLITDLDTHRRNVQLGIGHQSPDYQWWHGQPALDGDLIQIKNEIMESRRNKALQLKE